MITSLIRSFRQKLTEGNVKGPFSKTEDPAIIEAIGYAGFDFVILDLEHGPNSVRSLQGLIRAAQITGMLPVVRIKENRYNMAAEVLDIGAGGVQVPKITHPEEAREAVRAARYAPEGNRGVCRFVRAADYSAADRFVYFKEANEALIVIQVEGKEAIANIDSILEVKGIDVLFIGPYDLSQSLGVPGKIDHPEVVQAMENIVGKCTMKGVVAGTFVDTVENALKWKKAGVRYISYSVDIGLMYEKCREIVIDMKCEK